MGVYPKPGPKSSTGKSRIKNDLNRFSKIPKIVSGFDDYLLSNAIYY